MSADVILRQLVDCVAYGGNLLLNVGPRAMARSALCRWRG